MTQFAVSGQHYLFNVQTFASIVLSNGGDDYEYALRDRTTHDVIGDVMSGASELGVLVKTTRTADDLEAAFAEAGLADGWRDVIAIVVQPGVEFGDDQVFLYNRENARALSAALKDTPEIVFEGHSSDYQTAECLRQMRFTRPGGADESNIPVRIDGSQGTDAFQPIQILSLEDGKVEVVEGLHMLLREPAGTQEDLDAGLLFLLAKIFKDGVHSGNGFRRHRGFCREPREFL